MSVSAIKMQISPKCDLDNESWLTIEKDETKGRKVSAKTQAFENQRDAGQSNAVRADAIKSPG